VDAGGTGDGPGGLEGGGAPVHPVLFQVPALPAWVGAVVLALAAAVFGWMAVRDRDDKGALWMAGILGIGAGVLVAKMGLHAPVGPLPVRWFGILVVGGFLAATKVAAVRNKARGLLDGDATFDLCFSLLLSGIVGARAVHIFQNSKEYQGEIGKMLAIWDGGLVWYGGAVASTLYALYRLAKDKRDLWACADSLALGLPLGQAVGRLGCFLAGCDYGSVVEGGRDAIPWAVQFPPDDPHTLVPDHFRETAAGEPVYLHPTQLYLSAFDFALFGLLWWLDRRGGPSAFRGRLVALYLAVYAVGRGTIEHWRGDADRGFVDLGFWSPSFSQFVSIFFLAGGIWLHRTLASRPRTPGAPGPAA
jgi:phosphatidylglycerol:prolipoprotein diacylglycerol transferase